ncbi:MAG: hypothetical protein H0T42_19245 [Deltaproteobacteria bacterium]|nr:hypothetical protein [Deltaproteobacteria bacterium]
MRRPDLPPALGVPGAIAPDARGATYLTAIARGIQPNWAHFLEDCRVRLPATHALNVMTLSARAELAIDRTGKVTVIDIATSGNADFDLAVRDVLADASRVDVPPVELRSDDDRLHVRWMFARDLRQAGPATAELLDVQLPLIGVTERLLAQREVARAAIRVARSAQSDPDRVAAAERVMTVTLDEALGTIGAGARQMAVEAIGRAQVRSLAARVRALISPTIDTELRLAAIDAAAQLADQAAVPVIAGMLPGDLQNYPRLANAGTSALVTLGHRERAAAIVLRALDSGAAVAALHAHAIVPDPALAPRLATWFSRGDARTRAAVCAAVPADWGPQVVVLRGLRDPDATVRAACADTVTRQARGTAGATTGAAKRIGAAVPAALRDLVRDRDRVVRARAVAALSIIEPRRLSRAATDPAPEVRAASVTAATDAELRTLASDPDPVVRAAALTSIRDRAPDLVMRGAVDIAPQVRLAAINALTEETLLEKLGVDDSPEVATAAVVQLASIRGRAAIATTLLTRLAASPAGSAERVRIALGFLLAR